MKIYNGLPKDEMASKSGVPRRATGLAVFLSQNDNHMKGGMKIGEWFFVIIN